MTAGTLGRRVEFLLANAGLLLLTVACMTIFEYVTFQRTGIPATELPVRMAARLEIPRLGMSVLVVDGEEKAGLSVGAFHLAGTPPLGSVGNAVIVGHRDTAFWPLQDLKNGDVLSLTTGENYRYTVRSIQIVPPEDVSVLQNSPGSILTLVTCYPFHYIGRAPKRFVVRAELTS
jgi:sortase A